MARPRDRALHPSEVTLEHFEVLARPAINLAPPQMVRAHRLDLMSLIDASRALCAAVDALSFGAPAAYTYNPLAYAREAHELFLSRYGDGRAPETRAAHQMNPGPFGMGQTGVPFGDIVYLRKWMGLSAKVSSRPRGTHKLPPRVPEHAKKAKKQAAVGVGRGAQKVRRCLLR